MGLVLGKLTGPPGGRFGLDPVCSKGTCCVAAAAGVQGRTRAPGRVFPRERAFGRRQRRITARFWAEDVRAVSDALHRSGSGDTVNVSGVSVTYHSVTCQSHGPHAENRDHGGIT